MVFFIDKNSKWYQICIENSCNIEFDFFPAEFGALPTWPECPIFPNNPVKKKITAYVIKHDQKIQENLFWELSNQFWLWF